MTSACGPGIELNVDCGGSFNGAAPNFVVSPAPDVVALVNKMILEFRETGGITVSDDGRKTSKLTPEAMKHIENLLEGMKGRTAEEIAEILTEVAVLADGTSVDPNNVIRNTDAYEEIHKEIGIDPPVIATESDISAALDWKV